MTHSKTFFSILAVFTTVAFAEPSAALQLTLTPSQRLFHSADFSSSYRSSVEAHLKIALKGATSQTDTRKVNLAVVLDRSGSMRGEKLEHAKKAAIEILERITGDNERVSLFVYDDRVDALGSTIGKSGVPSLISALKRVNDRGGTGLFAGVSMGLDAVRKNLSLGYINRVILLSDGLANVGPSTPTELGMLGMSAAKEGISVTTVGLGTDYNEDLMAALANRSDGHHYFAAQASQLESIFNEEFKETSAVVAQKADLDLELAPGVDLKKCHNVETRKEGQHVYFRINHIQSGRERYVLCSVTLSPNGSNERVLANASVNYDDVSLNRRLNVKSNVKIGFTAELAKANSSVDNDVMVAFEETNAQEQEAVAMKLRDEGKVREAKQVLDQVFTNLDAKSQSLGSSRLKDYSVGTKNTSSNLEGDKWLYSKKAMLMRGNKVSKQKASIKE